MSKLAAFSLLFLAVCFSTLFAWNTFSPRSFLPISKWLQVQEAREPIGRDVLYCLKVKLTKAESEQAISDLALSPIINFIEDVGSSPANCKSEWWDINFPTEAQKFRMENNGQVRVLAAYKNGVLYHTYELR